MVGVPQYLSGCGGPQLLQAAHWSALIAGYTQIYSVLLSMIPECAYHALGLSLNTYLDTLQEGLGCIGDGQQTGSLEGH